MEKNPFYFGFSIIQALVIQVGKGAVGILCSCIKDGLGGLLD